MNDYPMGNLSLTDAASPSGAETTLTLDDRTGRCRWCSAPDTGAEWAALGAQLSSLSKAELAAARRQTLDDVAGVLVSAPKRRKQNRAGARPMYPAHLPAGLLDVLASYSLPVFQAAALDLLDALGELNDRQPYLRVNAKKAEARYGRVLVGGKRVWAWDVVSRDLFARGIIETEGGYVVEQRSMGYRLTATWREPAKVELVQRPVELWVPPLVDELPVREDGTLVEVPSWYATCHHRVGYDLEAAQRFVLATYGASEPPALDFASLQQAITVSTAPQKVLAACEAGRRLKPIGEDPTKPTRERGRLMDKDGQPVEHSQRDERPVEDIARGRAIARLRMLQRWRVEGVCRLSRDHAGWRLHSPVARMARELRQFLHFDGEPLVGIDCANSQMTLLARFALDATNDAADAVDFAEVCGQGRFYETAYELIYGRSPADRQERDEFKPKIMGSWLYAHGVVQREGKAAQALAQRWPSVHSAMLAAKGKKTRDLPCEMQRREARLWVDTLAPMLERINCPAVTAHDSVYVPKSREAEALTIIRSIYEVAGVRATFA